MDTDFMKLSTADQDQIDSFKTMMQMENSYIDHMNPTTNLTIDDLMINNTRIPFSISRDDCSSSIPLFLNSDQYSATLSSSSSNSQGKPPSSMAAMREMIFRIASMQPIHINPESVKPPKRRNVKISTDPQSVAARHRRERISERIRILQRLVPGGTKMDTASMLDEAIHYVKFLKNQIQSLERVSSAKKKTIPGPGIGFPVPMSNSGND